VQRFVLLDRDGTINEERHYLADPDELAFLPGAVEGLQALHRLGLGLVVVTNQSGIGRGYFDLAALECVHQRLRERLGEVGVPLAGIYFCPHLPDDGCTCRKPLPGLVERAAAELGFEPAAGFMIGDRPADIDLGRRVGATTFLVRTGYGAETLAAGTARPDHVVPDLAAAAALIARDITGAARV
jgi:D-glycero-D-manno-heptose 1,7-bisphosphate phosphatase